MTKSPADIAEFQESVWEYYAHHARSMPWREDHSPYRVLVSELMLQQTQVARVIPKFEEFMATFPVIEALASASLADVLRQWQGLGYNRRARFLHEAAKMVVSDFNGVFPDTIDELIILPGVGKNTAGAILAYAFDKPVTFIETNVRTVLFHHFFNDAVLVSDKELEPLLRASLPNIADASNREWYWALMDYGSHLKATKGGRLDTSAHYKKQAPLKGSLRETRGRIIKTLTTGPVSEVQLRKEILADERFMPALEGLIRDGLVTRAGDTFGLTG